MVQFIVRSGGFRRFAETNGSPIVLDQPTDISFNLSSNQIASMSRTGDNLVLQLINGEQVVLQDYFVTFVGGSQNRLFLSNNGQIQEITFEESFGRMNTAEFQNFSGNGDLMFDGGANLGVTTVAEVAAAPVQTGGGGVFAGGNTLALVGGGLLLAGLAAAGGGGSSSAPDTTAPDAPVIATNTSSGTSGTAEPGSTVTVDVGGDGTIEYTVVVGSDGTFNVVYNPAVPNGTTVIITVTDPSGNSTPATVTVDGVAPAAPAVTSAELDEITGTAEAGSTVSIDTTGDGSANVTVVVASNGTWTVPFSPPLAENTVISITATDTAGNVSTATSFTVDTIDPAVAAVTSVNADGVAGTGEAGATVSVSVNGGNPQTAVVGSDGTFTVTFSPAVADGVPVVITLTDPSGNSSNPISVNVDATPPVTPATTFVSPTTAIGTGAEPGATVNIDITNDGTPDGTVVVASDGTWSVDYSTFNPAPSGPLVEGSAVNIFLVDTNNNPNTAITFNVDGTAPVSSVVSNTPTTLTVNVGEVGELTVLVNGTASSVTQTITATGTTNISIPSGTYAHGDTVTVSVTDGAGNTGTSAGYTVDLLTADPGILVSNGSQISGTAEANANISVVINGVGYATTTNGSGAWVLNEPAGVSFTDGLAFTVTATDTSQNVSSIVNGQISTAPVVTGVGSSSTVDIGGTIDPNVSVQAVFIDGTPGGLTINQPGAVMSDGSGNWAVDTNPDLASGEEVFVALDTAGTATTDLNYTMVLQGNEGIIDLSAALIGANVQNNDITFGLQTLDISAIDLSDNVSNGLVLTAASVQAVSANTDTLRVDGVTGNSVDVGTATDTGQTTMINGQEYSVYDFGGNVTALIDSDITII